jgi:phosphoglycolate phosphatase-like HAD superfamily hydrolase
MAVSFMPLDFARIRALCFDVDGTLSDTDDQFVLRLASLLNPVRFAFPRGDPHPFARRCVMATESPGTILFSLPDRLNIDGKLASIGDFIYHLGLGKHPNPFLLVPGVKQALYQLKPHFPLAIVTARGQRGTQTFLNQFELTHFFDCIATAQTCRYTKPHPDPILWAAKKMGVPPEACLMIGDTTVDIRAGKAAGAQTVGVLCGFGEERELRFSGADLILASTDHLPEVLLKNLLH